MNVLHVHSGNMFGGVERMLQTLAPASAGAVPIASSYALCHEGPVADALRAEGAEILQIGPVRARRPDEVRRARRALREVLEQRSWSAAIVHSAWSQALFGTTILKSATPLVRWLHAPQPGPLWLETWAARSIPALVLCNSRYTLDHAGRRFGDAPLAVHYPPAAPQKIRPGAREEVRVSLGTRPDAVVLVLAARLEEGKGHSLLIDALARVRSPRWEAWIVGGAQLESETAYFEGLSRRAVTAGVADRVRFLGQRSDVPNLLAAADIYCQPNTSADSFGLSFVEAVASGLPVITSRLGGAPEIVDETCGILVQPGDVDALVASLDTLIERDDYRRRLATGACARAHAFCDLGSSMERLAAQLARVEAVSLAFS